MPLRPVSLYNIFSLNLLSYSIIIISVLGTLNLKKLDDVRELSGLESIVSLCPRLRHLTLSLGFNTVHDNLDSELLVRLSEVINTCHIYLITLKY